MVELEGQGIDSRSTFNLPLPRYYPVANKIKRIFELSFNIPKGAIEAAARYFTYLFHQIVGTFRANILGKLHLPTGVVAY